MTDDRPISELFLAMVEWMKSIGVENASTVPQPWRGTLKTPKGHTLKVALNCSKEEVDGDGLKLAPYHASITSDDIICAAVISPYGGAWGGVPEDYLIETFKAATAPAAA